MAKYKNHQKYKKYHQNIDLNLKNLRYLVPSLSFNYYIINFVKINID